MWSVNTLAFCNGDVYTTTTTTTATTTTTTTLFGAIDKANAEDDAADVNDNYSV